MFKKNSLMLITIIAITIITAGGFSKDNYLEASEIRIVTDMAGREVEILKTPDKILGLGPGALRLITFLQASDKVVGVEQIEKRDNKRPYILAHPELAELPAVGPMHGGDAELITAVDPDIIFHTYIEPGEADKLQRKTGIPVVVVNYGGIRDGERDTLFQAFKFMGEILNRDERVKEMVDYISMLIGDLKKKTVKISEDSKPDVYTGGIGYKGAHGIVSTEPAYAPFSFVNVNNVAAELGVEHTMISREKLIEWDPEIIFVDEGGLELVKKDLKRPEFKWLTAVKENQLYGLLPFNYYTTNYTTVFANAYYIGKVLYPDRFDDIDPVEKADEIYKMFLGKGVYDKMEEIFGGYKKIKIEQ